jgi:hypothetical protein
MVFWWPIVVPGGVAAAVDKRVFDISH